MSNTALAQKIFESVQSLPDTQAREVLDFVLFLQSKHHQTASHEWQEAQQPAMNHIWDNEADERWNDV